MKRVAGCPHLSRFFTKGGKQTSRDREESCMRVVPKFPKLLFYRPHSQNPSAGSELKTYNPPLITGCTPPPFFIFYYYPMTTPWRSGQARPLKSFTFERISRCTRSQSEISDVGKGTVRAKNLGRGQLKGICS